MKAMQGETQGRVAVCDSRDAGGLDKDQLKSILCILVKVVWVLTRCQVFQCGQNSAFVTIHKVFFHTEVL